MTTYSREELETAFQAYQDEVDRIAGSGDWSRFADLFTEERGRIVCDVYNELHDPGDGQPHGASNITILTYAGNGLWSCEEDIYNPATFLRAAKKWGRVAREHGRMTPEGEAWMAMFGG